MVAVNVTAWLTTAVVARLELTVLTGVFLLTTWVNCGEVAVMKFASPAYVATMTSDGATRELVVQVAVWFVEFNVTALAAGNHTSSVGE